MNSQHISLNTPIYTTQDIKNMTKYYNLMIHNLQQENNLLKEKNIGRKKTNN